MSDEQLERRLLRRVTQAVHTHRLLEERMAQGQTPCASCSRLRRGILYSAAHRLGATKIALGHHREDTLETLLLNLVYTGKLQAMPARYTSDDGKGEGFPILPCSLCGSQPNLKRDAMNQLLSQLEALNPQVRESMLGALSNVRRRICSMPTWRKHGRRGRRICRPRAMYRPRALPAFSRCPF